MSYLWHRLAALINALPAITNTANVTLTDVVIDDLLKTIGPEDPVPSSPVDPPLADADTPLPATPGIELVKTSALTGEAGAGGVSLCLKSSRLQDFFWSNLVEAAVSYHCIEDVESAAG